MLRPARLLPLAGFMFASCASVPVPATRSPENPAHPEAMEAVTPPAHPGLMGDTEAREAVPPAAQPAAHEGHAGTGGTFHLERTSGQQQQTAINNAAGVAHLHRQAQQTCELYR